MNSAASLLSSLHTDISSQLGAIVAPQIERARHTEDEQESRRLASQVATIVGTKHEIVMRLMRDCVMEPELTSNPLRFAANLFAVTPLL